jgi:hypothetical protein
LIWDRLIRHVRTLLADVWWMIVASGRKLARLGDPAAAHDSEVWARTIKVVSAAG